MKRMKGLIALVLVLMLCACGSEKTPETTAAPVETTAAPATVPVDDGKVEYIIHVVDESGAPISGAMVQICLDACYPGMTDANGQAKFSVMEADYKVSFLSLPAGYTYSGDDQEFYFDGEFELTITLKAAG